MLAATGLPLSRSAGLRSLSMRDLLHLSHGRGHGLNDAALSEHPVDATNAFLAAPPSGYRIDTRLGAASNCTKPYTSCNWPSYSCT